mgnify:CR=1 FL=1
MTTEERERRMAMLRAAQPYTSGQQRYALDLLLQANTLINTARGGMSGDLEACETAARPEEMLLHMQEYCTPRESDLVQMILNFIKAGHLFQNYREFMAAHGDPAGSRTWYAHRKSPSNAVTASGRIWWYGKSERKQPAYGISDHPAFPGTAAAF